MTYTRPERCPHCGQEEPDICGHQQVIAFGDIRFTADGTVDALQHSPEIDWEGETPYVHFHYSCCHADLGDADALALAQALHPAADPEDLEYHLIH